MAFTLVEVLVAVAIIGVSVIALYIGIMTGYQTIQVARENLRATQIIVERLETIRLYTLDQLTDPSFLPEKFTNWYNFHDESGFQYVGTITVDEWDNSRSPNYLDDLRFVTIELTWTNSGKFRSRTMHTLVARDGLQDYVY